MLPSWRGIPHTLRVALPRAPARKILQMEGDNLLGDAEWITLDPDRHPGNYRISVIHAASQPKYRITPIDFGQVLKISRAQREQIFNVFAAAQILKATGSTQFPRFPNEARDGVFFPFGGSR